MLPRLIKGWGIKRLGGSMYDRHVPLHLREKPHECEFCQKRFSEKSKLQKHIEAVHSKEKHHEWEFCQGRFSHKYSLQKHMMAIHLKEKLHECVICQEIFSKKAHLHGHIKAIHLKEKPHECKFFQKKKSPSNLQKHTKAVHSLAISNPPQGEAS